MRLGYEKFCYACFTRGAAGGAPQQKQWKVDAPAHVQATSSIPRISKRHCPPSWSEGKRGDRKWYVKSWKGDCWGGGSGAIDTFAETQCIFLLDHPLTLHCATWVYEIWALDVQNMPTFLLQRPCRHLDYHSRHRHLYPWYRWALGPVLSNPEQDQQYSWVAPRKIFSRNV